MSFISPIATRPYSRAVNRNENAQTKFRPISARMGVGRERESEGQGIPFLDICLFLFLFIHKIC